MNDERFVVDASVIVKWLNQSREAHTTIALRLLERAVKGSISLLTSDLAVHEVLNALIRGKGLKGKVLEEAVEAYFLLPLLPLVTDQRRASISTLIAEEQGITFYDAIYLAIAIDKQISLITANPKHQKSVSSLEVIPLEKWSG